MGVGLVLFNLVALVLGTLQLSAFAALYLVATFLIAVMLIFIAIAPEKVQMKISAILKLPKG